MFAKTVCRPGSYLCIVPVGLLTTLQYNSKGVLEKVFKGYGDDKVIVPELFDALVKDAKLVPLSVPIKGGTTWVEGVFYSEQIVREPGYLPECIYDSVIASLIENPQSYRFYAGKVDSLAASFKGVITTRNWLSMSKFDLLPMYMVPTNLTNEAFVKMVDTPKFPFRFPLISGYMIFDGLESYYHPLRLNQYVISNTKDEVDADGYIKTTLTDSDGAEHIVSKSDQITFNMQKETLVVCKHMEKVIYTDTKKKIFGNIKPNGKLTCKFCGNTFAPPKSGPVCCSDPHCVSKLYPQLRHFCAVLNIPLMEYETLLSNISAKQVTCFTDIFILPEYQELKVTTCLSKFLQAIVPIEVCADSSIFSRLAATCNNSFKTLVYYMNNPSRLLMDADYRSCMFDRLVSWLSDSYNILTITTLVDSGQFIIQESAKKFDGAPIFRGKHIAITGKFKRGDSAEIVSILQSYSAEVSVGVTPDTDCLVIGSLHDGIDGRSVKEANKRMITVFDEDKFFAEYDIDADLAANLL